MKEILLIIALVIAIFFACEIVRNTTKQKTIDKACEWLKEKCAFCYAGQYNNNEVSESEFREAMKG